MCESTRLKNADASVESPRRVAFDVAKKRILIGGREPRERLALGALRMAIEGREPGSIRLAKGCERAAKRAVDVVRCARFSGAGAVAVGRNQARRNRVECVGFGRRERFDRAPDRCAGRLSGDRRCWSR